MRRLVALTLLLLEGTTAMVAFGYREALQALADERERIEKLEKEPRDRVEKTEEEGEVTPSPSPTPNGCGELDTAAVKTEDGSYCCVSPATDGITIVNPTMVDGSLDIMCKACGSLNEPACKDVVTFAEWCVSPATDLINGIHPTVQVSIQPDGTHMCMACGSIDLEACNDPNDNSIHSCTSPGPDGETVEAVEAPEMGGDWMHFKCVAQAVAK
jgi:hypothetical protein